MRQVEKKSVHVIKMVRKKERKKLRDVKKKVVKVYVADGRGGGVKRPSFHHDATTAVDHRTRRSWSV